MTCNVVLQNYQGTYSPEDTILGHLLCTFTSMENIQGVRVKLIGKEHTAWTEREPYFDSRYKLKIREVVYSGDNEFLTEDITLLGEKTMTPGSYEYPFVFTLPRNLPTTDYHGSYGNIKYFIKGTVDMSPVSVYEDEMCFEVPSPIDFNLIRSELQMEPCTYQEDKIVGCFYCLTGPITIDLHLEKEAFVLGEVAKVKIDVSNLSNEIINEMTVKLKTVTEFKATSPKTKHKYDTELWASNSVFGVEARGQRTYELNFNIPDSAAIYNFSQCTLLKQWSVLRVEAVVSGCDNNMEVEVGVVIGHKALEYHALSQSSHDISYTTAGIPENPPPPISPPPPYPASDKAAPYPLGSPAFPGKIGFSLSSSSGSRYSSGPGFSATAANAPPAEFTPSAPTQAEMAHRDKFGSPEQPPPSYSDAVNASFSNTPDGEGSRSSADNNRFAAQAPK